jgi:type IV secretory pathway VirB2 component (pilin)
VTAYRKGIIAALIAVLIIAVQAFQAAAGDGAVDTNDWLTIALAVLGAVGVYLVPNAPPE